MSNLSKEPKLLEAVSKLMEQLIGKSIQARPLRMYLKPWQIKV